MPFTALPADRARAESGVRAAYAAAGLTPPASFLWVGSPAAGALLSVLLRPGLPAGTRAALLADPALRPLLEGIVASLRGRAPAGASPPGGGSAPGDAAAPAGAPSRAGNAVPDGGSFLAAAEADGSGTSGVHAPGQTDAFSDRDVSKIADPQTRAAEPYGSGASGVHAPGQTDASFDGNVSGIAGPQVGAVGTHGFGASGVHAPGQTDASFDGGVSGIADPQVVRRALEELIAGVETGACVRDRVRTEPWERERAAARAELGPRGWAEAWARTGAFGWERVNELVTRVRRAIDELGGEERGPLLRAATLDAVLGQHDAPWLELFASLDRLPPLRGLAEVAASAGWWWPYENLVILSERPVALHRDEPGRLHNGDGPALAYPDGFALHAWRGMPIPPGFLGTLSGLTARRILAEDNAELRRVMLEHFGYDRYLAEVGARPLHRDETGVLWRIDLPGDEPVVMVEVVNSTPEPDGTSRTYYLRVPPDTRTARAGVAWTFGLTEDEYRPLQET